MSDFLTLTTDAEYEQMVTPFTSVQDPVTTDGTPQDPVVSDTTEQGPTTTDDATQEPAPTEDIGQDPVADNNIGQNPANTDDTTQNVATPDGTGHVEVQGVTEVAGGRVTVLELGDQDIDSLTILNQPDFGRVTVNPDNTFALVLTGTSESGEISFDYEVTLAGGAVETRTVTLNVSPPTQDLGWGLGDHYMLEEDASGNLVVEHGDNHRKVYISGSDDALTRADIAAMEGISESQVNRYWLAAHPEYGGSEEMALSNDIGMELWSHINNGNTSSNWLLFEGGYTYKQGYPQGDLLSKSGSGEDPLHPMFVTSYGEGAAPIIEGRIGIYVADAQNFVISGVTLRDGAGIHNGSGLILDDVTFEDAVVIMGPDRVTIRNSTIVDVVRDAPSDPDLGWQSMGDRISGLYVSQSEGMLIEGSLFDHNAWEDGYDPDGSIESGQPPSMFSHNIYMQQSATDVTFRDNITMRAASLGAQFRGGVHAEDNLFLDNNGAVNFLGGYDGNNESWTGNYTYFSDNVITSGAHKEADMIGAYTLGVDNGGLDTTLLDNIIAHLADPNNPDEFASKYWNSGAFWEQQDPFFDNTIIYNWLSSRSSAYEDLWNNEGANGLSAEALNQITIQNFAADLLNRPEAAIADLANYLREQSALDSTAISQIAGDIIAFFQQGFGIAPETGSGGTDVRFVPNPLADGVRWDTSINWTGEATPGATDRVYLGGNWVTYGAAGTNTIASLDLGPGGILDISSGKLTVTSELTLDGDGEINLSFSGQFWNSIYADLDVLSLSVDGGRFANTDLVSGSIEMTVTGGQALLGIDTATFGLSSGSILRIEGDNARVGFDGTSGDIATFQMESGATLSFVFGSEGVSAIEEFRSGFYGNEASDVASLVDLGGGTIELDLSALALMDGHFLLIEADELVGSFEGFTVTGLGARDARLIVDYDSDTVSLELFAGSGGISQDHIGTGENQPTSPDNDPAQPVITDPDTNDGSTEQTDGGETVEPDTGTETDVSAPTPSRGIMEFGSAQVDHNAVTIELNGEYDNPVVIASLRTDFGSQPAVVRIEDISNGQLTFRLDEPENLDGWHMVETVDYMVVEAGSWQLADGTLISAGLMTVSGVERSGSVGFDTGLEHADAVFAQHQESDATFWATARLASSDAGWSSFLQVGEGLRDELADAEISEEIGWVAFQNADSDSSAEFQFSFETVNGINHKVHSVGNDGFLDPIDDLAGVIHGLASFRGGDTAFSRGGDFSDNGFDVYVQEETTGDKETAHMNEDIALLSYSTSLFDSVIYGMELTA
ncbi:right-handed parallel beta-helix repeat-containing protein [Tropicimonas sp. IMCC6043]|uniref:right-handed parallel beta-helix repeat-containing protein n=1 Tax=Tropicimonas sp. IMCC6043 TaxID=2510645 RepID=UPI00101CD93A|nr:right-handed parallel beta-helix repeat-containing protein [Tropicimonas sp. IMCC6043]RYH08650.1 right-handed parallel beta-helix repeat-containing protein [Tropicimonas sp. IMCC6043]